MKKTRQLAEFLSDNWAHLINAEQTFTMLPLKNLAWQGSLQQERYLFHGLFSSGFC